MFAYGTFWRSHELRLILRFSSMCTRCQARIRRRVCSQRAGCEFVLPVWVERNSSRLTITVICPQCSESMFACMRLALFVSSHSSPGSASAIGWPLVPNNSCSKQYLVLLVGLNYPRGCLQLRRQRSALGAFLQYADFSQRRSHRRMGADSTQMMM